MLSNCLEASKTSLSLREAMNDVSDQNSIYSPCNLGIQNIYNVPQPCSAETWAHKVTSANGKSYPNPMGSLYYGCKELLTRTWYSSLKKKLTLVDFLCLAHTICFCHCWNSNYIGICDPFTVSIQTNFVATRLERWKARKPSHVNHGCVRTGFNGVWCMDKDDDLPSPGTILPVWGQYSEGPWTYRLWSIRCRSSSKLHRLDVGIHRMVPLAIR